MKMSEKKDSNRGGRDAKAPVAERPGGHPQRGPGRSHRLVVRGGDVGGGENLQPR